MDKKIKFEVDERIIYQGAFLKIICKYGCSALLCHTSYGIKGSVEI